MVLHGVFRAVVEPRRMIRTETNADCDAAGGIEALTTAELLENNGRTVLTSRSVYPSRNERDAVLNSGMERGVAESYDQLSGFLLGVEP
jgi:uncharacterized protein YndB with AHSA1/START domain